MRSGLQSDASTDSDVGTPRPSSSYTPHVAFIKRRASSEFENEERRKRRRQEAYREDKLRASAEFAEQLAKAERECERVCADLLESQRELKDAEAEKRAADMRLEDARVRQKVLVKVSWRRMRIMKRRVQEFHEIAEFLRGRQ